MQPKTPRISILPPGDQRRRSSTIRTNFRLNEENASAGAAGFAAIRAAFDGSSRCRRHQQRRPATRIRCERLVHAERLNCARKDGVSATIWGQRRDSKPACAPIVTNRMSCDWSSKWRIGSAHTHSRPCDCVSARILSKPATASGKFLFETYRFTRRQLATRPGYIANYDVSRALNQWLIPGLENLVSRRVASVLHDELTGFGCIETLADVFHAAGTHPNGATGPCAVP